MSAYGPPGNRSSDDQKIYDGIFCYALIHLLAEKFRSKLIADCYHQLTIDGYTTFVSISKNTATYGEGVKLSEDRFETRHGVKLYYYNLESVDKEFGNYGLIEAKEINEPSKTNESQTSQKFWQITCRKEAR